MASTRRLAAIMFTDITGYSAMMESNELQARMIRNRHREVFKDAHERYNGKILQYFGDGTLSIFESTATAVECGVDMQIEFRKEPEVPLRIGIHSGDIAYDEEGAYGDGLNIASRLERLCIPGGVFISAKVFDDIKNHPWLTAVSLGFFHLRNITQDLEVFAVTAKSMAFPTSQEMNSWIERVDGVEQGGLDDMPTGRRKKAVAFLLALPPMGVFGLHRFYVGQRGRAIAHFVLAIIAIFATIQEGEGYQILIVLGIIGMLDAILMLAMPRTDFDDKYNRLKGKAARKKTPLAKKHTSLDRTPQRQGDSAIVRGIELYKKERYHEAIREFIHALQEDPKSSAAYFNLACCHSILRDAKDAYFHLAKAVELGFKDHDRILQHEALSFLRDQPDFEAFHANGFRKVGQLPPAPVPDLLEQANTMTILDRLELLGDRLEKGELSRDEFEMEKKKLLGRG
ncbi:MAG TPA: NINE protein [Saprospiraceae bacterium]|nr:NINE protein [Saprospiraceae bacterium]